MPCFLVPLHESNDCHNPGGSPAGGEFCSDAGSSGGRAAEIEARMRAGANLTPHEREHAPALAKAEAEIEALLAAGGDTLTRHFVNGEWTAERRALHAQVLERYFREAGDLPTGLAEPTAIILAGLPGAGKSTATKKWLDTSQAIVAEADKLKALLPEYTGANAPIVQRESSYLANLVVEIAMRQRMNVVVDGTMRELGTEDAGVLDGAFGKLVALHEAGFRTEVVLVDVTTNQSIQRVIERFLRDGRYVPPSAIRKSVTADGTPTPTATFDIVKDARRRGVHLVDAWSHYDGWTGTRKGGRGQHRLTKS